MNTNRRRKALITAGILGFFTVDGLLSFGYRYLEQRIFNPSASWIPPFIDQMTGVYGAALLAPGVYLAVKRLRTSDLGWPTQIALHLLTATIFSVLHTAWNAGSRAVLYPLAGLGAHNYGGWSLRVPMEYFNDLSVYVLAAVLLNLFFYYRETQDRELRAAKLESELTSARLRGLEARLNPHFLFNTLNVISSTMYRSVEAADRMITQLGQLLRRTLDNPAEGVIPLRRELALLDAYAGIMQTRFGERLEVRIDCSPGSEHALVPSMLLQPLVENAIEHGVAKRAGAGRVDVFARPEGSSLVLRVTDDGPGLAGTESDAFASAGIGLSTTRERLHQLYGSSGHLELVNRAGGGLEVVVTLPLQRAPGDSPLTRQPEVA